MSEIEELLRRHVANVDATLSDFEDRITSVQEAASALGSRVIPAASRAGGPLADQPAVTTGTLVAEAPAIPHATGRGLHIAATDRKVVEAIMRGNPTAAMREMSDPDGGYLVPEVLRDQIESLVQRQSPIRRVARIVDFTNGKNVIPVNLRGATAGWVGELEDRTETDSPQLGAVIPPGGTLYALPSTSEELVDDAIVNMDTFLEENVVDALAETESRAFIYGDGIKKPAGFLSDTNPLPALGVDGTRQFGSLQYVPTDTPSAVDLPTTALLPILVATVFSLKAGYRQAPGTAWLASSDFIAKLARINDGDGKPIYLPSLREDVPGMLLGYPVIECEHMPALAPGAYPLAFGNWQRGYIIGDRTQLSILRDPYTTKGVIKWYFRKRVHGAVLNSEAIKLVKMTVRI